MNFKGFRIRQGTSKTFKDSQRSSLNTVPVTSPSAHLANREPEVYINASNTSLRDPPFLISRCSLVHVLLYLQPPCITPSDAVKNLQLCLNAAIDVAEISDVLTGIPSLCLRGTISSLRSVTREPRTGAGRDLCTTAGCFELEWPVSVFDRCFEEHERSVLLAGPFCNPLRLPNTSPKVPESCKTDQDAWSEADEPEY
jgi:hypothetical protein